VYKNLAQAPVGFTAKRVIGLSPGWRLGGTLGTANINAPALKERQNNNRAARHVRFLVKITPQSCALSERHTYEHLDLRLRRNLVRVEIGCERLGMALTIHRGHVTVRTHEINGIALQAALPHVLLPAENVQG
jgi:hypothetical protein